MTTDRQNPTNTNQPDNNDRIKIPVDVQPDNAVPGSAGAPSSADDALPPLPENSTQDTPPDQQDHEENRAQMNARLERLGGEPAPDITPEEFARLQQSGHLHIDAQGRVRSPRYSRGTTDSGVSLRKRRAWYGCHYC
jgi:hypothetical protein